MSDPERFRQMSLGLRVSKDLIPKQDIEHRDPQFVDWAERTRKNGNLVRIIHTLKSNGVVSNEHDALDMLEVQVPLDIESTTSLRVNDFQGERIVLTATKRALNAINGEKSEKNDPSVELMSLNFGSISHRGIVDLYTGNFGEHTWHTTHNTPEEVVLFDQTPHSIFRPLDADEYNPDIGFTPQYVGEVEALWKYASCLVQEDPVALYRPEDGDVLNRLEEMLGPVFGRHLRDAKRLGEQTHHNDRYIYTLLSWANALVDSSHEKRQIWFSEVPVMWFKKNGFDGGRIDALEIMSLDGQEPTSEDEVMFKELASVRYPSAGNLLTTVQNRTGTTHTTAKVIDFKFAVGDALKRGEIINPEDVEDRPLPKHQDQIARYLTLAPVDFNSLSVGEEEPLRESEIWNSQDSFIEGEIIYFHPFQFPVRHTIILTPEQKARHFEQFRERLPKAQRKARIRTTDSLVARLLEDRIDIGKKSKKQTVRKINPRIAGLLQGNSEVVGHQSAGDL
jgi:hypothetical protein